MVDQKRSIACKNRPKHQCQYCGRMIGHGNLKEHEQKCYRENFCKRDLLHSDSVYCKYYNKIIQKRIDQPIIDGYKERHHIKPKCIGGTNDLSNLVNLTAREHYICHLLLCKIFDKSEALHRAFIRMSNDRNKKFISSRHYEEMKSNFAELRSQKMKKHNHMSGRVWVNDGIINKSIKSSDLLEFLDLGFRKGRLVDKKVLKLFKQGEQVVHIYKNNECHLINLNDLLTFLDNGWKIGRCESKSAKYTLKKENYIIQVPYSSIKVWQRRGWVLQNILKVRDKTPKEKRIKIPKKLKLPEIHQKGQYKLINDTKQQQFVSINDLEMFLNKGWKLGGIKGLKAGIAKSFRTQEHKDKLGKSNKERALKRILNKQTMLP